MLNVFCGVESQIVKLIRYDVENFESSFMHLDNFYRATMMTCSIVILTN